LSYSAGGRIDANLEMGPPEREVDVLRRAVSMIERRLPHGWTAETSEQVPVDGRRVDALVRLSAPDGAQGLLVVEAKRLISTRDVPAVLEQLHQIIDRLESKSATPLIVSRYLAASTRERLEQSGAAYADATGNMRLALARPALYLRDVGADRDPWRGPGRPRGTLKGPPAARVVRALVDFAPPMTMPQLIQRSGASVGAAYRVIEFLEREALIERAPAGLIVSVNWRRLLERWSEDYGFQRSNAVVAYLQPRGLSSVLETLRTTSSLRYVLTGSLAAQHLAPYAPPRLAMVYVDDFEDSAKTLGLRPVDTGANVLLATGDNDVVFERLLVIDGLQLAAPSQVVVDLLTGPGRSAAEAQALLDWMKAHEQDWRR
jgi:hypothetical protein